MTLLLSNTAQSKRDKWVTKQSLSINELCKHTNNDSMFYNATSSIELATLLRLVLSCKQKAISDMKIK